MAENAFRLPEVEETEKSGTTSSDVISVVEACKFLGIHRNTLYKLLQAEELPAFRLSKGGRWRFRRRELEQWLEDQEARRRL
jgi:excisionase family DNA binding protein